MKPPMTFSNVLDYIDRQPGACLFIDEADALLGAARDAAAGNHSVEMRKSSEMISRFLEWSQGLKTREYVDGQACGNGCSSGSSPYPLWEPLLERSSSS